jgi:cytochrome oxidase Cu insertion factor (SCO1/SenC/PrrC family)
MKLAAPAVVVAVAACAVAACTNGGGLGGMMNGGGGGGGSPSPLPSAAIGVGIPTGKIGVENDPVWGTVSGYTQNQTSQVLAFAPGAKITIQNLSSTTPHTLNVIGEVKGPPAKWPKNPSLSFYPSGDGVLGTNYASGTLNPGASVTVTLSNPGIYLIGCAFHYIEFAMRDVIQVVASATPGPTASPGKGGYAQPATTPQPLRRESHLVDQRGRAFTLSSLRGEPLVVTFVSAHCTDACPLINAQFSQIAAIAKHDRVAGRLLTVTLDPEHDTLQTMRELAARFDADPARWLVAGGSVADVHQVMRAFRVISVQGKHGYRDEHTTFVYVFDSSGELAQTMLASTVLRDDVVAGLRDGRWENHS